MDNLVGIYLFNISDILYIHRYYCYKTTFKLKIGKVLSFQNSSLTAPHH